MSWSAAFIEGLGARTTSLRAILGVYKISGEPGSPWTIGSHPGLGTDDTLRLGIRGIRQQGATLSPISWSTTVGMTTVTVVGDPQVMHQHVTRGTCLALYLGLPGMDPGDFEVIAVGPYRSMRGVGPAFTIEILDLLAAMPQRWALTNPASNELFYDVEGSTTLAADYTVGDSSVEVASTGVFQRETGSDGAVLITPSTGDPFYLLYSGTATGPARLTGVSAAAHMGTTAADAVAGNAVTNVAYLAGHPLDIVRKVLMSREQSNSVYDTLPARWGLGILNQLVDNDDIDAWRDSIVKVATGTYQWKLAVPAKIENAYEWLTTEWSRAGMFPTIRQGRITWRAARSSVQTQLHSGLAIRDTDVVEVLGYEDYDAENGEEYSGVAVYSADGSGALQSETPATLPALDTVLVYQPSGLFGAWPEVVPEMTARLSESGLRVPERLRLLLSTCRWAQWCPGDMAVLYLTRVQSRRDGKAGFWGRQAHVVEVSPQWCEWTVAVTVLVYPDSGTQFA